MDRKQLISLLQHSAGRDYAPTPFCPDDDGIAGFVDGTLSKSGRRSIDHHLPDCPACIHRVGLLTRLLREKDATAETTAVPATPTLPGMAPRWAAAATVILAIAWVTWGPIDNSEEFQQSRSIESLLTPPEILAPGSGTPTDRDDLVIRWTEVPGSLYYEVRIVSDAGNLLSEKRVEKAEWAVVNELDLQPGREYFIRVDAYLSDSQSIRSEHIPFRVRE